MESDKWQAEVKIFNRARQRPSASWRQTTDRAFTLMGNGRFEDAGALLVRAADLEPWLSDSWFNLALLHKFRRDWEQARAAGLRAVALLDRNPGAPDWWNLGIAATALQDWALARRCWQAYGLRLAPGEGPVSLDYGTTPVRLSPEGESEVVWGRRLDPARVEVLSIPLPSSGRRWGEVVLHDGSPHGERVAGGVPYPVFDEIELWAPSPVPTYVVLLQAETEADRDALERLVSEAGTRPRTGPPRCGCSAGTARRAGCRPTTATASTTTRMTTGTSATAARARCGSRSGSAGWPPRPGRSAPCWTAGRPGTVPGGPTGIWKRSAERRPRRSARSGPSPYPGG